MTVNHWVGGSSPSLGANIGEVAEWFNAPVLKTGVGESLPWVQIPPSPPYNINDAALAQLVEQLICNHQVCGSSP